MIAFVLLPAQHLGRREPRRAAADDHDLLWLIPLGARLLLGLSDLLAHEDLAVALFDAPRRDGAESRRARGLSGPEIEAGVMPGAPHRVIDNEPLSERAVVVGAQSADGEHVGAAAHEQHRFIFDMADEFAAVWQFGGGNSELEIGTGWLRLIFSHFCPPRSDRRRVRCVMTPAAFNQIR